MMSHYKECIAMNGHDYKCGYTKALKMPIKGSSPSINIDSAHGISQTTKKASIVKGK